MNLINAVELWDELSMVHNLRGWSLELDNAKRRFGVCKQGRRVISLSRSLVLLNDEAIVKDVILHEIAHALAGRGKGHGREWRDIALSIGCNGERVYGDEVQKPKAKYTTTCPTCGKTGSRHRKTLGISCGKCSKTWKQEHVLIYTLNK